MYNLLNLIGINYNYTFFSFGFGLLNNDFASESIIWVLFFFVIL
jgi:hypothetical protein